jgi:lysozyme
MCHAWRMLDVNFLDAIKKSEGYSAESRWDYAQNSNGYGTRARYAGEVIDKAEADKRFKGEVEKAADFVDKFAPGLDEGSKAALTSLTYNAGTAWSQSGLGEAVSSGDIDKARSLFLQYNKAGGSTVDGLVQRRLQEVTWFGQGEGGAGAANNPASPAQVASAATDAISTSSTSTPMPDFAPPPPASVLRVSSTDDVAQSSTRPFSDLGYDPALIALLAHLSQNHLARQPDGEQRKPDATDTKPQAV